MRDMRRGYSGLPKFLEQHGFTPVKAGEVYRKQSRLAKIRIVKIKYHETQLSYATRQHPTFGWWVRVWAMRPGMWELIDEETVHSDEKVIEIIKPFLPSLEEAVDPKRILPRLELGRGTKLGQALSKDHWKAYGSGLSWSKEFWGSNWDDPPRRYYVWWDNDAKEWVLKKEGKRRVANNWSDWKDMGYQVYQNEDAVLQHLVSLGLVWIL